ncbi:MAG: YqgE/AlgH family protein [Acidimicrobiales bacterium]
MSRDPVAGSVLVASPVLQDPNFDRTVVLVLAYGDDGALGLVLNRPSETELGEPLPQWGDQAAEPPVVFVGGPVARTSAICLARCPESAAGDGWQPLFGPLGTLDLGLDPEDVPVPIDRLRVFAGYAGWGAGQLDSEIAAGAWFVVAADAEDALSSDPAGLWRRILARQTGALAALANFPLDLAVN